MRRERRVAPNRAGRGRGGLWWGLMLMAALTFGSTPSALTGLVFPTRAPAWMALPLFAGLTLLILGGTKVPPLRVPRYLRFGL